jgi:formylglycine-generating enzyme required for sulfatase activity/serine/threonine protein kinase
MPNEFSGNASAPSTAGFDPEYLKAGQRISQTFTLRSVIPSALGEFPVWLAEDEVAGRQVALHFVPAEVAADPALRKTLKEIVRKTKNLHHDNILRVHELVEGPDWAAVVTNAYDGQSFARSLQEAPGGSMEASEILHPLEIVIQTLTDVHGVPVLHGNICPADVILTSDGGVLLSNFGTRRAVVDALRKADVREGKYLCYTSPQVLGGATPTVTDDIYALGATLFELLTGKRVFEGADVEARISSERPPGVIELRHKLNQIGEALPRNWERAIAQCLSKDPSERPMNIVDLSRRLGIGGEPEVEAPAKSGGAEALPPEHMGVAGEDLDEDHHKDEASERISAPRPLLTSFPPEKKKGSKKALALVALVAAGAISAWMGSNFLFQRPDMDLDEEDTTAATSTTKPAPVAEKAPDIKFNAPTEPGSTPDLTALRPGQLPRTKPAPLNGPDPAMEASPTPITPEPPTPPTVATKPPAVPVKPEPAALASATPTATTAVPQLEDTEAASKKALEALRVKAEGVKAEAAKAEAKAKAEAAQQLKEQEASAKKEQEMLAKKEAEEIERIKAQKNTPAPVPPVMPTEPTPTANVEKSDHADKAGTPAKPVAAKPVTAKQEPAKDAPKEPAAPAAVATVATQPPAATQQPAVSKENSLGMTFVKVGDVQFATRGTRVKDYAQFVQETGYPKTGWKNPGFEQTEDHPVVNVSWTDALSFCKWLTDKDRAAGILAANESYRLPTDLEWSKAVGLPTEKGDSPEMRDMGIQDQYPWGTQWPPPKNAGNYTGKETGAEVAIAGFDDGYVHTSPVGAFAPNALGIYDMGGNVWQWCMDTWNPKARSRVLRGGSWDQGALRLSLLSSCRIHSMPDRESSNYGFRVVRATSPAKSR